MKITKVEALPFRIPMKKATVWARGKQDAAEHVLVKVHTDEGITGFAEAPPRPTVYGESLPSIKSAIEKWFAPIVVGMDPFAIERVWDRFDSTAGNNTAKASIDIAIHDIIGKAFNLPCYKLAGNWTDTVQLSWCVNLNPIAEMVKEAQDMIAAHGFKTLKLKAGVDPKTDVEMVKTMRKELGGDVIFYVDINQGYDPYTAIDVIRKMMEYNITFIEEPCPIADKKGRKLVSDRIDIPMMGDESCFTPAEVWREISYDWLRIVSVKAARTGFTLSKKIIDICEQAGVRNLNGLQGDTGIGSIASAHVCAAHKNSSFYYPSEISFFLQLTDDFLTEPLVIKDGCLKLSDKPGLGVEIDEKKFAQFALT